jgi:hypothetical protein
MKYNIEKMIQDHETMKGWHEQMAKSAADSMQGHIKAAAWHTSQADLVKAMMNDVPLDPEKKVTTIPTAGSAPTPTSGAGKTGPTENIPLDPESVKKADLVEILNQHVAEFGDFDMDVETIANFLIND